MMGYLWQPGALFLGLDKAFFSTNVPFIFARQGRNHYTFYLDTPYLPFLHPSFCLISFPVLDCGGD